MSELVVELEVYSNGQWRDARKKGYVVTGRLSHLRAFCERRIARDLELDPTGMSEYHVFYIDPNENLSRDERDAHAAELTELDRFLHPGDYDVCHHGLSANGCYDPVNHWG